ncbi:MAG TPA: carboxypeptidase-like regulatory domain-containing protein [Candidatus Thermoplasmatota archaeon]
MRNPTLASAVVLILLVAGCAGKPSGPTATETLHDDLPGGKIRGIVTDESLSPVANASVTVAGVERFATTGLSGRFEIVGIEDGTWSVAVTATGYEFAVKQIEVRDAAVAEANFELITIPIPDTSYHTTAIKSGRIFCGADWRIDASAPQGPLAACGALYTTPANNVDSFAVTFDLSSNNISAVRELVFETQWVATQTFGNGLRVFWEAYQEITPAYEFTEDLRTFIHLEGTSPLWGAADYTDILDNVTGRRPAPEFCAPNGPCKFWGRVFPHAGTLGSESPVDFSTYVDQSYTHYVTEFYGEKSPPRFSALTA